MGRARNFWCSCWTTRDDPSPPTTPEGSGIYSSEKGGPSKGDGSSVPGVAEAAAVAMDGKKLANGDDPSPPHPPTPPESSGISSSEMCDNLMKAAEFGMDGKELADPELDRLINYMGGLLEILRGKKSTVTKLAEEKLKQRESSKKKLSAPNFWSRITSTDLGDFKEFLTGVTEFASALKEMVSANNVAVHVLKEIGHTSLATAGLLVVATVLEKFENVSEIQKECLDLFEEMYILAKHVREVQGISWLKQELKDPLKKATELILAASILCCAQIDSSRFNRFFSMSDNKANLLQFREDLKTMYREMDNGHLIANAHVVGDIASSVSNLVSSQKTRQAVPIKYPKETVGLDEPLRKVIELLEWQSEKKALAVVVHGFGGLGKTTLADAVYATLSDTNKAGCRFCMVKLFDTIESTPNVIDLQTQLIKQLRTGTTEAMPTINTYEEGQREISRLLDQQAAFIYIDNVLLPDKVGQHGDALKQLLPEDMKEARKLRLLLTARDTTATKSISVKTKLYPIQTLHETEAKTLFKKVLDDKVLDDNETQLTPRQMDEIVRICGGVPQLLRVVAGFIGQEGDAQEAFRTVMADWKDNWKGEIVGNDIKSYVFACNKLNKDLREAFLDVCLFFQGWDWEELSNIVGEPSLQSLQRRMLVTQDVESMTATVHDVILKVGLGEIKGERRIFDSASKIQDFLDRANDKTLRNIKGIWCSDNTDHTLYISAKKLDFMAASLRVLKLGPLTVVEDECQEDFEELVFFSARISSLPFVVSNSEKLRHLCFSPEDLPNLRQMPSALRHIDFQLKSPSFEISPECIEQLKELRVLRLENAMFKQLPGNLGDLGDPEHLGDGLQELTLLNCNLLEELPELPGSLRVLRMDSCSRLTQLPEDFGKLTSLQELHLVGCESLEALPDSLEELSSLRLLDLSRAESIEHLPDGLGKLTSLVDLLLNDCRGLKELPDGFCDLSITRLAMDRTWCLKRLPARFGKLTSLRRLSLNDCMCLEELPESFSQLKYLEYLNLSNCTSLEELCELFKDLSSLRVLLLHRCIRISKLPQDFNDLPSLDTLVLTDCPRMEGKSMESIVKLKKLQTLLISGSHELLEKWGEIQEQCDQSWSFAVETGEPGEGSLQARDDFSLTDGKGKAFNISHLPLNTDLLVLFDCQQEFRQCSTLTFIEENMDDNLEMIYFGNHFSKLPHKVAGGIRGHAPAKLFEQLFPLLAYRREERFELSAMRAEIVPGEKGEKTLSCGETLYERDLDKFVVEKCGRYLKFKQLVKTAGDSNIELLRELFANGEFLKNGASTKVGVEELKGKRILLDMRPANLCYDIPLQSLVDLYNVVEKERFEIITIPMMQENTRRDVSNSFSREVPWLVLQNPWDLPNATKYFLIEGSQRWDPSYWEAWYPSKMRVIESNGTIAAYNSQGILCMVNAWGTEAFPFTEEKGRELMDKEAKQVKEMSYLMFLFQHLQGISEQVEKAMRQQKMFCLCIGDCTTFMKTMLGLYNIYTIYIPLFYGRGAAWEMLYFTHGRSEYYRPLQHPTAVTQVEMEGMCSLSLSEHEAIRFWARIDSLSLDGRFPDFTRFRRIYGNGPDMIIMGPGMIIMDEDGNLITMQGIEIIELLSEEHSHDKAKSLVQQLINGDKESRKETLIELQQLHLLW